MDILIICSSFHRRNLKIKGFYTEKPLTLNLSVNQPYEAIYHFNLYTYLVTFLQRREGQVIPEFPTGTGQIDLLLKYNQRVYGVELKSYVDAHEYGNALLQALRYAKRMKMQELWLVFFVQTINLENRQKYETAFFDHDSGITIQPVFITTNAS